MPPGMPCVSVLNPHPEISSVEIDDYQCARAATEYLLEMGHRKIAYLTGIKQQIVTRRVAGYEGALRAAKIKPRSRWHRQLLERIFIMPIFARGDSIPGFCARQRKRAQGRVHE